MRAVGTAGYRTLGQYAGCVFSAKGAAFNQSPPQDGFAVANLGHRPRDSNRHANKR